MKPLERAFSKGEYSPNHHFSVFILVLGGCKFITPSAEVTLNGGLVRESPQNPLNSGLGIILICPVTLLLSNNLNGQPVQPLSLQS